MYFSLVKTSRVFTLQKWFLFYLYTYHGCHFLCSKSALNSLFAANLESFKNLVKCFVITRNSRYSSYVELLPELDGAIKLTIGQLLIIHLV